MSNSDTRRVRSVSPAAELKAIERIHVCPKCQAACLCKSARDIDPANCTHCVDTAEVAKRIAIRLALGLTETDLGRAKHRAKNLDDEYLTRSGEGDKVLAAIADVIATELASVATPDADDEEK